MVQSPLLGEVPQVTLWSSSLQGAPGSPTSSMTMSRSSAGAVIYPQKLQDQPSFSSPCSLALTTTNKSICRPGSAPLVPYLSTAQFSTSPVSDCHCYTETLSKLPQDAQPASLDPAPYLLCGPQLAGLNSISTLLLNVAKLGSQFPHEIISSLPPGEAVTPSVSVLILMVRLEKGVASSLSENDHGVLFLRSKSLAPHLTKKGIVHSHNYEICAVNGALGVVQCTT